MPKEYGTWCQNNLHAIAINCEYCQTRDPERNEIEDRALVRISIVNAEKPDDLLLDTLVKPVHPVTQYYTPKTGITEASLKHVKFTLIHAQAFLQL